MSKLPSNNNNQRSSQLLSSHKISDLKKKTLNELRTSVLHDGPTRCKNFSVMCPVCDVEHVEHVNSFAFLQRS